MKYVSIDVESTGLNIENCDILELGAVIEDTEQNVPIEELPVFHRYFIKDYYNGEPFALSMHPHIFRRIADREVGYNYCTAMKVGNSFKKFLCEFGGYDIEQDKVVINVAGKNFGAFDLQLILAKTDIAKHVKIRGRILDPAILLYRDGDESLPSLSECKKRIGIDDFVSHNAVDDAIDVIKIFRGVNIFRKISAEE
jgi:oligoribonuclease